MKTRKQYTTSHRWGLTFKAPLLRVQTLPRFDETLFHSEKNCRTFLQFCDLRSHWLNCDWEVRLVTFVLYTTDHNIYINSATIIPLFQIQKQHNNCRVKNSSVFRCNGYWKREIINRGGIKRTTQSQCSNWRWYRQHGRNI